MTRKPADPPLFARYRARDLPGLFTLLDAGADIDAPERSGRTVLMEAVIDGETAVSTQLLARKARTAAADRFGFTALHCAAQDFRLPEARLLLQHGAPVDAVDEHGNTPLFKAAFHSRGRGEMIALLLQHGADPDRKNYHGMSSRALADSIANYDVAQFFGRD